MRFLGKVEKIEKVSNAKTGTIQTQNAEPVMVKVSLYHYVVFEIGGYKASVAAIGHHDTIVATSQIGRIDKIN